MKLTVFSRVAYAALFTAAVLTSVTAVAKDGRDFAGHYSLTNVTDKGGQVELTLALHPGDQCGHGHNQHRRRQRHLRL